MTTERVSDASRIIDAIVKAHDNGDVARVRAGAHTLYHRIRETGERLSENDWKRLFKALRDGRVFDYMRDLAELLFEVGHDENPIRAIYAQALIEGGRMTAARCVLEPMRLSAMAKLEQGQKFDGEELEAVGLAGRSYKQSYIEFSKQAESADTPLPQAAKDALADAIRTYGAVLAAGNLSKDGWHDINFVALAKLGERLGVLPEHSSGADQIAAALIKRLEAKARLDAAGDDPWPAATVGEAYLAFGQWKKAAEFYGLFASHKSINAFRLGSAIRQLEEIWQLDRMAGEPKLILQALKARLASMPGGELELPSGCIQALGEDLGVALEAVFGKTGPLRVEWFQVGLKRARSVARIMVNKSPLGTGFLVPGKALSSHLEDKPYLLTNAHVLSEPQAHYLARPPHAARVHFEEAEETDRDNGYGCELVWQSGVGQLDASVLELRPSPPDLEPFPLADRDLYCAPGAFERGEADRVNVIGHPGTEKLSISIQDNQIMDIGPRGQKADAGEIYYHYKTPTKPGNSGSPVCHGDEWTVYALHHAGPAHGLNKDGMIENTLAKLNGAADRHEANEGVSIVSIKKQIHGELAQRRGAAQSPRADTAATTSKGRGNKPAAEAAE